MNIRSSPSIGTPLSSGGLVNHFAVAASPVAIVSILGTNNGPNQYIQIWDATAKNDAGATLLFAFPIPAGKPFSLDTPLKFTRGCYLRNASALTHTAGELAADTGLGAADCLFTTRHI